MDQSPSSKPSAPSGARAWIISGVVVVVIGAALYFYSGKSSSDTNAPQPSPTPVVQTNTGPAQTPSTQTPPSTPPVANTPPTGTQVSPYKAGTYSADGSYSSPGGQETVGITLTIQNDGTITDGQTKVEATNGISVRMQTAFSGGMKAAVVGKNISTVNLTKVSGSSLTPGGFNDAVAKIKAQAQTPAS